MKIIKRSELIEEAEQRNMEVHEYASQLVRENPEIEIENDIRFI